MCSRVSAAAGVDLEKIVRAGGAGRHRASPSRTSDAEWNWSASETSREDHN